MLKLIVALLLSGTAFANTNAFDLEGHRGARARFPENTLQAYSYALDVGVTTLEMDMQVTKDNVIVMSHDFYITPELCLDSNKQRLPEAVAIRTLTLKQVKQYDCGSLQNPRFPLQHPVAQQIPTLDEVFTMVERSKASNHERVQFNIETKSIPGHPELSPAPREFVDLFLKVVRAHHMESRVILQSFDHRTLRALKERAPQIRISALIAEDLPNLLLLAKDLKAEIVSPNVDWITAEDVQALHHANVRVVPWTANTASEWDHLLKLKVDGIISDDPEALRAYLRANRIESRTL